MIYCRKCGRGNDDDAAFCQRCGSAVEPEEETRVAKRESTEPGAEIFAISPTLLFVKVGYGLAVVGGLLLAGLISVVFPFLSIWVSVLCGISLLMVPAFYHVRQKLVRYRLTDAMIEIDRGLMSRTTQNIPLRRIQDVTVTATMLQRVLGFGDIVIDNASEDGGKIVLDNINSPRKYADMLLKQMHRLEA